MKKIVILGGHFTPALALIEELERNREVQIYFFGRKYATEGSKSFSAEYLTIEKKKIKFFEITTGRLQRRFTRYTISSLFKVPLGLIQSFYYLLKIRPKLIVSFGSYVSVPVVFAGWLLGIESITHEPALVPGLATKINSLFVKRIFLSWPQTQKYFDTTKTQVIGNLIRKDIFKEFAKSRDIRQFLERNKNLLYVTGGNQGSHFLNELIFQSQKYLKNFSILHQLGTTNFQRDYKRAKRIKSTNYKATSYISSQDIGAVFNKALIVISRAGSNTLWELVALGKVATLIPLPISASGEQEANAQVLEQAGAAIVLNQETLTSELFIQKIQEMFNNLPKYQKSAQKLSQTLPRDAAQKLASYISSLVYT